MSSLIVEVSQISSVEPHPNADRLEIATIKGWRSIVQKGQYQPGNLAVFVPPDAMIPQEMIQRFGLTFLKGKKGNQRVGVINLRGVKSEGLVLGNVDNCAEHTDVALLWNITKYEPPEPIHMGGQMSKQNPLFLRYTDIENIKNFPSVLVKGETVVITEKIHGTNFRCGWVKGEWCVGSHRYQTEEDDSNIYSRMARSLRLKEIVPQGTTFYGEIYGKGIQDLAYEENIPKVRFFDVTQDNQYLDFDEFSALMKSNNLEVVPILYRGEWQDNLINLSSGNSMLATHTMEGFVVKPTTERYDDTIGRVIFKAISFDYLNRKNGSEFH